VLPNVSSKGIEAVGALAQTVGSEFHSLQSQVCAFDSSFMQRGGLAPVGGRRQSILVLAVAIA
jgi:hypothetical protein